MKRKVNRKEELMRLKMLKERAQAREEKLCSQRFEVQTIMEFNGQNQEIMEKCIDLIHKIDGLRMQNIADMEKIIAALNAM